MLLEEVLPHRGPGLAIQLFVFDADVNPALEGRVEGLYAIGRQEHDTYENESVLVSHRQFRPH